MTLEEMRNKLAELDVELRSTQEEAKTTPELEALEQRSAELIEERNRLAAEIETAEREAEEKRRAEAEALKVGKTIEKEEEHTMTDMEIRNTKEYIEAYANYIKTGSDKQCRALLTENATGGTVPVPEFVENRIQTAWDRDAIISRISKTYFKGNVKFGFERSATAAAVHAEGAAAPAEEVLTLGIVTMAPETIKKWITFSDEVLDLNGEAFLDYIYDEISHKIIKFMADTVVSDVINAVGASTATMPGQATVASTGVADFINAVSMLSDEATDPVIILNKQSYAYYKGLQLSAQYAIDPFDGMTVLFNDSLDAATGTGNIAIVGDLAGYRGNFPKGDEVEFKYDDLSLAESDLVKVVGRLPWGHGVIAPNRFCVITKA